MFGASFPFELLSRARRLRWIQSINAGVDDLLAADLPESVLTTRITGQFGGQIAEYVFAELLARIRQLDQLRAAQRDRRWAHFVADTLNGKTLGVAGLGSIGREIVRKARAFDMRVHGLSRTGSSAHLVDRHYGPDGWEQFVAGLDALVLALPRTQGTEGVVGRPVLGAMRPHAVLVNIGRGSLVDEAALVDALREGRIGGAVLDVFQHEPLPAASPFWTLPGVVVTPHVAGPSTVEGVGRFFLDNLDRYLSGRPLAGVVDRTAGY